MKKKGILNSDLLELIASAGHGDIIVVTDRGFPLPSKQSGIRVIDLGIVEGLPAFTDIVSLIVNELEVESIIYAEESNTKCSATISKVKQMFSPEMPSAVVSHARLKTAAISGYDDEYGRVIGFVRTGEFTPYANVMLQCGVVF